MLTDNAPQTTEPPATSAATGSATGPLRHRLFRRMWVAQFLSNCGGWMQTVGAQWLMLSLTTSTLALALIQTAASLPVLLFAVYAGALGDLVDRRRLLLSSTMFMLAAAAALGVLTIAGLVTPWSLLTLLFLVGVGQALTSPTWQSLQPELVPDAERPQAIALGAVNQNLARAVGPAIGGALVAITEPGVVFLVNAATFLAVLVVLQRWRDARRAPADAALPAEHLGAAVRAGGRYVRSSPALRWVLMRAAVFMLFASALWALLPAVAAHRLGLAAGGDGLLIGSVGVGAVIGAALLPRLRALAGPDALLTGGSLGVALTALALAEVRSTAVVAIALVLAGVAWITSLATLNAGYQSMLPGWVKARGMGVYLVVFQGGTAIGSAAFGALASAASLRAALLVSTVGLAASPLLALLRRFPTITPDELVPVGDWPVPVRLGDEEAAGPVLVTIEYRARPGQADDLRRTLHGIGAARRRTGATDWRTWSAADDPDRVLEAFVVASWDEHVRQHARVTKRDAARLADASALAVDAPVVTHWLAR